MSAAPKKPRQVSGTLTVRAESNDPKGLLLSDPDAFDKSVEKPKVLDSKGSGFKLTKVDTCPHFMSKRSGHKTDNYRVHELVAMYAITLDLEKDADVRRVAEEFALFAMWQVKGFNPTSFSVMLCTDTFDVVTAGDMEPDMESEDSDGQE